MPTQNPKKTLTMWERIKAGMATIGEMADTLSKRNKKRTKPPVDTGRAHPRRRPVPVPTPNPQQQAAIDKANEEK